MNTITRRRTPLIALLLALGFALTTPAMARGDQWFHVRIDEGRDDTEISINIPISLIQSFLPFIEKELAEEGDFDLNFGEVDDLDIFELFEALRDAPDANFVTVRSRGEDVTVAKENGFLKVNARDGADNVIVQMPMEVVEVLAQQRERGRVDLGAALDVLVRYDDVDLVRVESADGLIRVWIDDDEEGRSR